MDNEYLVAEQRKIEKKDTDTKDYNLYKDIQIRTDGMIYLGVVGPVRTGKSSFIRGFMDLLVLPFMDNTYEKERTMDEMF